MSCSNAQAPDNGFCESVLFWHVREDHYGDVKLDNLSFVRGRWEGDLWGSLSSLLTLRWRKEDSNFHFRVLQPLRKLAC